jgi:membrane-bound lytic murein transglycosylase B
VLRVNGQAIPDTTQDASVFLPAGARGPAFLVLPNFRAILKYNNAASYALAIVHLADRIAGGRTFYGAWPRYEQPLSRSDRVAFQTALAKLGYDVGDIDGVLGRKARAALRAYQKSKGFAADGFPTSDMLALVTKDAR